jgi:hypothetical protein
MAAGSPSAVMCKLRVLVILVALCGPMRGVTYNISTGDPNNLAGSSADNNIWSVPTKGYVYVLLGGVCVPPPSGKPYNTIPIAHVVKGK